MLILGIAGWIACGILTYGLYKYKFHYICRWSSDFWPYASYDRSDEFENLLFGACWPITLIGLGFVYFLDWLNRDRFDIGLCFRMPRQYCRRYKK